MRTIISFVITLFIHLGIYYFFLPQKINSVSLSQPKLSTIDLSQFNLHKKGGTSNALINSQTVKRSEPTSNGDVEASQSTTSAETGSGSVPQETGPTFIHFEQPQYPRIARVKGLEGKVRIRVFFNNQGAVSKIELLESSSHLMLDEAVRKSALTWIAANKSTAIFEKTFEFKLNN